MEEDGSVESVFRWHKGQTGDGESGRHCTWKWCPQDRIPRVWVGFTLYSKLEPTPCLTSTRSKLLALTELAWWQLSQIAVHMDKVIEKAL